MKTRYCECGREAEKNSHLCSECAYYNRKHTMAICQHNLKKSMNERQLEYYHRTKKTRSYWKNLATQKAV